MDVLSVASDQQWQFWVDRGGTFTDVVARLPSGEIRTHKLLSENPEHYPDAAVEGIRVLLGLEAGQAIPRGVLHSVKMGTTVATNALLERKGEPTLLVTTAGFEDQLRIGYQNRPRLFDLHIRLPEMLYSRVIGADERLDQGGEVLRALDQVRLRAGLQDAFDAGFRAVAIAFVHGYRFPEHEQAAGEIARQIGFTQVSLSHAVSPLVKLVSRGDTTVVDAYLSPVLRRYVGQVRDALGGAMASPSGLMFMQSNGGLADAALFQGKDAILSGPAGGVVGMVRTAQQAGFDRIIGFDMGGTSTDVCHFAGDYEQSFETEVAGVRLRAPMMNIHTVAAGGGSILKFEDGRLQVGPESAGANPGPACYRRGGPLTVTDCNVLLGKVQASYFPAVFGPGGDQPLDRDVVVEKFRALAGEIAAALNEPLRSPEELAEGFLRIAVENMANAIKKISVQRGYDVTGYTLNSFGGAGGQHACQVADVLGMEQVFLHPFAGVLSAFGMGLADVRASRQFQFDRPLSDLAAAAPVFETLSAAVREAVAAQGIAADQISVNQRVHVRTAGAHQSLPLALDGIEALTVAFVDAHQQRYGFRPDTSALVVEMLEVEGVGRTGQDPALDLPPLSGVAHIDDCAVHLGGAARAVPVFERARLAEGETIDGPALLTEDTGTTMVEPGWRAQCLSGGNLLLSRVEGLARQDAVGTAVDPIMLEVFNNQFMAIADQMGATLENTAYSVNIKERLDFSCALFDARGDLVANAPHVPVHLGSMSESVKKILHENAGRIRPGDVFMMNNPFNGGTHLPDVTVITPVFGPAGTDGGAPEIVATVASRGHHADIGGRTPGSAPPDSRHITEEGVVIDNFRLVSEDVLEAAAARDLLLSGDFPCRNVEQNMADLAAQIAANSTGEQALRALIEQYRLATVHAYMDHVKDNAEESVRRVIDVLGDARFTHRLDTGAEIRVAISVDHARRSARLDFTGTSAQDPLNYNAPASICRAVVLYVFRTLVGKNIPMNEGCLQPLELVIPEGSMINPRYPAAVISGNTEVSQAIAETLYGALGVLAGSQGTMNNFVYGNDRVQNYETICGGTGAGPDFDGASAVHSHMTNTRMTDPEVLEQRFPVRVEAFAIRQGSGGHGRHRGGEGIERRLRFLEPMTVTVLTSHRVQRPHGAAGGEPGQPGENWVERADGSRERLAGNDQTEVAAGDQVIMLTPGGGGFGPA